METPYLVSNMWAVMINHYYIRVTAVVSLSVGVVMSEGTVFCSVVPNINTPVAQMRLGLIEQQHHYVASS
jgi:hypothetical protein